MADAEVDYYLRIGEVEKQSGLSRATIYRRMAEGTFPLARDLGGGMRRWEQSRITAWKKAHPEADYRPPTPAETSAAR